MNGQVFNCKGLISLMSLLDEFEGAYDSTCIHENAAGWHFGKCINGSTIVAIKAQFTLSSNDANGI